MKPFDLKKALAGEPFMTRTGIKITEFYYFKDYKKQCKLWCVINGDLRSYHDNGIYFNINESQSDLVMIEPEQWVNVYWFSPNNNWCKGPFPSEEIAKENSLYHANYQATIKLKDSTKEN